MCLCVAAVVARCGFMSIVCVEHLLLVVRYNTPKYRFVVRFSRKAIVCQIVYATVAGDVTVAAAYSQARPDGALGGSCLPTSDPAVRRGLVLERPSSELRAGHCAAHLLLQRITCSKP